MAHTDVPAPGSRRGGSATTEPGRSADTRKGDRLLPLIALERTLRSMILIAVGAVLLTHTHTAWGRTVQDIAYHLNFNPHRTGIQRIISKVGDLSPNRIAVYGGIALAYGALEAAEAYGLWRRRRWGEYLTVIATALLLIPEVLEIIKKPSVPKVAGTLVNLAIVVYLIVRLRRRSPAR